MADDDAGGETLRDRITRQGEDALGKLAQDLLENPLVTGAITRAFEAREQAVSAQETAMSALNLPSAADLERLTRRLRSVSQRLEGIEDGVDRLDRRLEEASPGRRPTTGSRRSRRSCRSSSARSPTSPRGAGRRRPRRCRASRSASRSTSAPLRARADSAAARSVAGRRRERRRASGLRARS